MYLHFIPSGACWATPGWMYFAVVWWKESFSAEKQPSQWLSRQFIINHIIGLRRHWNLWLNINIPFKIGKILPLQGWANICLQLCVRYIIYSFINYCVTYYKHCKPTVAHPLYIIFMNLFFWLQVVLWTNLRFMDLKWPQPKRTGLGTWVLHQGTLGDFLALRQEDISEKAWKAYILKRIKYRCLAWARPSPLSAAIMMSPHAVGVSSENNRCCSKSSWLLTSKPFAFSFPKPQFSWWLCVLPSPQVWVETSWHGRIRGPHPFHSSRRWLHY